MTTTLDLATATAMLQQLAQDDAFREQMLGDPVSAMATLGVTVDPATVPAVRQLPSKAEIAANLATMAAQLEGKESMDSFFLA